MNKFSILFIGTFLFYASVFAQDRELKRDTLLVETARKDTLKKNGSKKISNDDLYQDIRTYSGKNRFTHQLSKLILRTKRKGPAQIEDLPPTDWESYSQDYISRIHIESYKPLGYSLSDKSRYPNKWYSKLGNFFHIRTKDAAVTKFFFFREGDPVDPLEIEETARLLRAQSYVREVLISPTADSSDQDSLDIKVEVLDSWSLVPRFSASNNHIRFGARERNFMGLGHQAEIVYGKRFKDGDTYWRANYTVPNIKNTFIDVTGSYMRDFDHYFDRFLFINRDFYSPLARWAGGVLFQERSLERPILKDENHEEAELQNIKYRYQNYWGGLSFPIFGQTSNLERTTNLILSARTSFLNYLRLPDEEFNKENYFSDEQFYLASIGIASRQYVHDRYIFRDGETEDVPIGMVYSITAGVRRKLDKNRFYLGLKGTYGSYFNWGFMSANLEAGTFLTGSAPSQTTINIKLNYFSNLMDLGNGWRLRQFIKPQFVIGVDRLESASDRVGLNEDPYFQGVHDYSYIDYGNKRRYIDYKNGNIEGFESLVHGKRKYIMDLQSQFYAPWNILGFHLNPFINLNLAYLAGSKEEFGSNKFYSSVGVGFIIRNDYLVFDLFQVSLSYFPSMPGENSRLFKTNSIKTEDFGYQDFRLNEPRPVIYE